MNSHLLVSAQMPTRTKAGQAKVKNQEFGSRSPSWVAGTQSLETSLLPPRVCISWELKLGDKGMYSALVFCCEM